MRQFLATGVLPLVLVLHTYPGPVLEAGDYYPLARGNERTYLYSALTGADLFQHRIVVENGLPQNLGGRAVTPRRYTLRLVRHLSFDYGEVDISENLTNRFTEYVGSDENGIYLAAAFDPEFMDKPRVLDVPLYLIRGPDPGRGIWTYETSGGSVRFTVAGTNATVIVAAGRFAGCLLVTAELLPASPEEGIARSVSWYAPGIGLVKETEETFGSGEIVERRTLELISVDH